MDHETLKLAAVLFMSVIAGALSGLSGGAGGVIMTPFFIWLGLTPQQTIATGKFASFGLSVGSLAAFRAKLSKEKHSTIVGIFVLSLIIGLVSAVVLQKADNQLLQKIIGLLLLLMAPVVLKEKLRSRRRKVSGSRQTVGYLALLVTLTVQGIMGSGVGTILSVVFIFFFGATALEANMLQRVATLVLNGIIVLVLLHTGLILYAYGFAGMLGALIGGYIGSKWAINKGNRFAQSALAVFMVLAGLWLILTA